MNKKRYNLLHYLLIVLMMLAPVSNAMAVPSSHCDMASMSAMGSNADHQHQLQIEKQSCCETNSCTSNCNTSCNLGVAVSLLIQAVSYSPVFLAVTESVSFSTEVLVRTLTPPSRPPANFS